MTLICGVEEAGRGPVIGPLVMAGVTLEEEKLPLLEKLGVKDSKLLTPKQREDLFEPIIKLVKEFKIEIISAEQVDAALNDPNINLNWLEALTSIKIIEYLKPNKAILDCPSNNLKAYKDYIVERLKIKTEIISEHKADLNYPIVGAASILAKVTRDREIEKIKNKIKIDFGSGYPSDPKTKEFLKKNYKKHENIFRKTWSSYKNVAEAKKQSNLGEF